MVGFVKSGADQIVHRGVHDQEILSAGALDELDTGQKNTGVTGNETAWLHQDTQAQRLHQGQ